jgi:hypothetical protein
LSNVALFYRNNQFKSLATRLSEKGHGGNVSDRALMASAGLIVQGKKGMFN